MKKQIIALGGGGFAMEPDNTFLDDYILSQSNKETPKICFIGTASGDSENYRDRFYECYKSKKCIPSHLSLFKGDTKHIREFILNQDIIFVGGGNTRNMLVLWKEWDLIEILTEAYNKGIILSGMSAGAICWFEQGLTDSIPNELHPLKCLGILKGSYCPHFDGESERQDIYISNIKNNQMKSGFGVEDGVALHFVNEELINTVSSRVESKAFYFDLTNDVISKEVVIPLFLNKKST